MVRFRLVGTRTNRNRPAVCGIVVLCIDVKNVFYVFYSGYFFTFFNDFYFPNVFYF